jgi:hypothetical protein
MNKAYLILDNHLKNRQPEKRILSAFAENIQLVRSEKQYKKQKQQCLTN